MKKTLILTTFLLISAAASAEIKTQIVRVFTGYVNPRITPFGAFVDHSGNVLYVEGIRSVLAPINLRRDCFFTIFYSTNPANSMIRLYPPQTVKSCGHPFPADK